MSDQHTKTNALMDAHMKAWNSGVGAEVARTYSKDAIFIINRGDPMVGHGDIGEMAAGFMAEFPDMKLTLNSMLLAGDHMLYTWTFEGHHVDTKNFVRFPGWEEWELDDDCRVKSSLGWFDADDYARQVAGEN